MMSFVVLDRAVSFTKKFCDQTTHSFPNFKKSLKIYYQFSLKKVRGAYILGGLISWNLRYPENNRKNFSEFAHHCIRQKPSVVLVTDEKLGVWRAYQAENFYPDI